MGGYSNLVVDENGKIVGYVGSDGKVYDIDGILIGYLDDNGNVYTSRGVKIGAVIKKDMIAVSPKGYSLGIINNRGEVINSKEEIIGKVLPNSLIKATENDTIIGKAVIGGIAVGWGCEQLGYVDKDAKVKKDGKDTGYKMLFDGSIVDKDGKYVGDTAKIGWVHDNKCNITIEENKARSIRQIIRPEASEEMRNALINVATLNDQYKNARVE